MYTTLTHRVSLCLHHVLDEADKSLLPHYRKWVVDGHPEVTVSGKKRAPDEVDVHALFRHVRDNHEYYARRINCDDQELLDRVKILMKLRNDLLTRSSVTGKTAQVQGVPSGEGCDAVLF